MRANEFITEDVNVTPLVDFVQLAQKYLTQMFSKGIADRAAVQSVVEVLMHKGASHQTAAHAAKQAFTQLKGSEVTTEGLFDA